MLSLRVLCVIGFVAGIQAGLVRRDLGHHKGGGQPISSAYGPVPVVEPAPAYAYGAPAPVPAYDAPAPVSSYGVPPASSYSAPSYGAAPIYYEDDKPDLKAKFEDFKSKIVGTLGYMKGSILAAKGKLFLKKAQYYQDKGEKLVGIGESLKALKQEKHAEPAAYAPPPPAPIAYPG